MNNVAIRKLRITSKDRVNAIKQRNRQLRKENQILVQQVGLLASELQIKLPSVLKEFPQLEEETNTPEESNQSNDGNLNEPYDNPPSNSQVIIIYSAELVLYFIQLETNITDLASFLAYGLAPNHLTYH